MILYRAQLSRPFLLPLPLHHHHHHHHHNNNNNLLLLLVPLGLAAALSACPASSEDTRDAATDAATDAVTDAAAEPELLHVSPETLQGWLAQKDFLLINVHVPYAGQIPGTDAHLSYADVDAIAAYVGADLDRKVVLYCFSDTMALIAGPALVERGYRAIHMLDGGMAGWTSAGYSLE